MFRSFSKTFFLGFMVVSLLAGIFVFPVSGEETTITDDLGREVTVPLNPDSVICSGAGCLRYLTYLQAQDKVIAVDALEVNISPDDSRAYRLANPQFGDLPIFGEFRKDDPEKITNINPQVIFKTYTNKDEANQLQDKTGIPVVALNYGDLVDEYEDMQKTLRLMGKILNKENRAEEVISFFNERKQDLSDRTKDVPDADKISAYVGGVGCAGSHGLQGTSFAYTPFQLVAVKNVAAESAKPDMDCGDVAKESIIGWDPDMVFIDLGSQQLKSQGADALSELKKSEFEDMKAVKSGDVYGLLSFNWYTTNQESVLADAYYIGKLLYPEKFSDIDPVSEADEIYEFLVGKKLFSQINRDGFEGQAFTQMSMQ